MVGSSTSQTIDRVVAAKNGSMLAVAGSGISVMSDSLIAFQPAIEEPSNIVPSAKMSSSIIDDVEGHVLPLAARVGEAEVDVLDVVVLDRRPGGSGQQPLSSPSSRAIDDPSNIVPSAKMSSSILERRM